MKKLVTSIMLMGPVIAFAQITGPLGNFFNQIRNVVNFLIPLLLSVAVLVFFWGLVKYIMHAEDEGEKEAGKTLMIWGMIALFVMVAFWGIIGFFQQSLSLTGNITTPVAPTVNLVPTT